MLVSVGCYSQGQTGLSFGGHLFFRASARGRRVLLFIDIRSGQGSRKSRILYHRT